MNQIDEMKHFIRVLAFPKRGTAEEVVDLQRFADQAQKLFTLAYLEDESPGYSPRAESMILTATSDGELKHKAAERVIERLLTILGTLRDFPATEIPQETLDEIDAVLQPNIQP